MIVKTQTWIKIVLIQINRIMKEKELIDNLKEEDLIANWDINVQRIGDDHFLKIALKKSIDWMREFSKYVVEAQEWLEQMMKFSEITDLRNMAEHEIEYYTGNGNKQQKYINAETKLSASETGILDGDYLIGGRLKLIDLKSTFEKINSEISKNNFTSTMEGISNLSEILKPCKW